MSKNIWRTAYIHCQGSTETKGILAQFFIHVRDPLKDQTHAATNPRNTPLLTARKVHPRAALSSFQILKKCCVTLLPGVQKAWTDVLSEKSLQLTTLGATLQALEHCNRFYFNNTRGSSLNKSQVGASFHWKREIIPHEEVSRDWPSPVILPVVLPLQGLLITLTCTSDDCLQNLPDPIFPWCLQ